MAKRRARNKVNIDALKDVYERCAGIDVHKESVTVCVIGSGASETAQGEVDSYGATTRELKELRQWLQQCGVTHIVMESTGVYFALSSALIGRV